MIRYQNLLWGHTCKMSHICIEPILIQWTRFQCDFEQRQILDELLWWIKQDAEVCSEWIPRFCRASPWTEKVWQETVGSGRAVERQAWYKGIQPFLAPQFLPLYSGGRHGIKGSPVLVPTKNSPELWLKHPLNWLENDITDILPLRYVSFDQAHDLEYIIGKSYC